MAVFRVERTTGYTVMSNHHLRNKELTLKAKGLLSQMLSLPENWDYTLAGLSYINRESIDAIRTAIWELEKMSKVSGIGENKLRELMDSGELEYIQNGNRRLIADAAIWDCYHRAKKAAKPPATQGG